MPGKSRRNPVTDEQIAADYAQTASAYKTAKRLGVAYSTVYRVLNAMNIERVGLKKYREEIKVFDAQTAAAIREKYEAGATVKALTQEFNGGAFSVRSAVRRAGGKLRPNPIPTLKPGELETIRSLSDSGMSQLKISLKIGRSQCFVSRVMRKYGIRTQQRHEARHAVAGGYIRVSVHPDDALYSMANNAGFVLEHRLVMARSLGRPLLPTETVHHVNGDVGDNRLENLQLRQGRHGKGVVACCLDCGSTRVGHTKLTED